MKQWRVAKSLNQLLAELNKTYPFRAKESDGAIGNAEHASRSSDHNPWVTDDLGMGVITARDFTYDRNPADGEGIDIQELADALVKSRDPRIKYIICNGRIISSKQQPWVWRKYTGKSPHDHHLHLSVDPAQKLYDDASPWNLDLSAFHTPKTVSSPAPGREWALLKKGSTGAAVKELQNRLRLLGLLATVDGDFGDMTEKAVINVQRQNNLKADGLVGKATAKVLGLI